MVGRVIAGAAAGMGATLPMTGLMEVGFHALPDDEQYPLPPRQITTELGRQWGFWRELSEKGKELATLAAHVSYGGAVGAAYATALPPRSWGAGTGAIYGLGVWAGSYLGLLPAMGLLRPATKQPLARNVLMIAAHLVWGAALGATLRRQPRETRRWTRSLRDEPGHASPAQR
jgi:uncharacterized membrane protein YagU involved in acid resistance